MNIHLALPTILAVLNFQRDASVCEQQAVDLLDCIAAEMGPCLECLLEAAVNTLDGTETTCADIEATGYCAATKQCACPEDIDDICNAELDAAENCLEANGYDMDKDPMDENAECCGDRSVFQIA